MEENPIVGDIWIKKTHTQPIQNYYPANSAMNVHEE